MARLMRGVAIEMSLAVTTCPVGTRCFLQGAVSCSGELRKVSTVFVAQRAAQGGEVLCDYD